jgi:hypothetical protein
LKKIIKDLKELKAYMFDGSFLPNVDETHRALQGAINILTTLPKVIHYVEMFGYCTDKDDAWSVHRPDCTKCEDAFFCPRLTVLNLFKEWS